MSGVQSTAVETRERQEAEAERATTPTSRRTNGARSTVLGVLGLTLVLAVPLIVALVALREPRWFPLMDQAQYELYVRDVPTWDPPLLGLPGRIYGWGARGSHPGPIGFIMLWPVYGLLGSDGWSLQVSAAVLVLAAAAVAIWAGYRRGGWALALAVTAMLALLMRGYGHTVLIEAWNPHLPIFWWVAFMLAVWGTLCRDTRLLPIVVFAGSVCTQTHISYIPLVGGLSLLVAADLAVRGVRAYRAQRSGSAEGRQHLRHLLIWSGGSVALGVFLWLLPIVEQFTHTPGNLSVIGRNFTSPVDDRLPADYAFRLWTEHLDVTNVLAGELKPSFPYPATSINLVGLAVLGAWAAAASLAWRRGVPALRRLHLVVGVATLLGLVSASRIIGPPWPYLTYWAWGTTAVMVLATVWTFLSTRPTVQGGAAAVEPTGEAGDEARHGFRVAEARWARPTVGALAAVTLVVVGLFAWDAPGTEMDEPDRSAALGEVVGPTVERLEEEGCDDDCRVLVTWTDEVAMGMQYLGVLVGLEREGIDARGARGVQDVARSNRVTRLSEADFRVHLTVGDTIIDRWRRHDDAELVASYRPRPGEVADPIAIFLVTLDEEGDPGGRQDADA